MYRSLTDGILIMLVSVKRELNQTIYNLENRFEILTSGTMAPSVCTDNFITIWDQRNRQAVYINAKNSTTNRTHTLHATVVNEWHNALVINSTRPSAFRHSSRVAGRVHDRCLHVSVL